ncbi:hypothetical protein F0562_012158 [Nyssa sinensis]|uniref:Endonuclease/exonuclease/phosphatase domain-containing protein n=1 Tax=Nyssa sinensis TaxID=561372 RepID=A0A5J4ZRZ4_9ASTE|nr:hypothetical protein F0562_012158 [Nyssa sinensis]
MRRSSPSLQFLAAAASTDASMFSRAPYRGGRNSLRRGFSEQSSGDGTDQFVTGDSHFRSVRDANRAFRPAERGNFAKNSNFRPQPRPPYSQRPHFNPPPPLDHPLPFNQNQTYRPQQQFRPPFGPPPVFNQNQQFRSPQQFRPRPPKPLDYRNWEFARPGPPPHCERFTVLSYNILADYLAINHRSKLYFHIPRHVLDWEWRKKNIIFELGLWSADILCLQEVDRFQDLEELLKLRGYNGIWKMRTGDPVDGCAIFWRVSRFKLLHEECIEFNKLGLRDNVAQICVLELVHQNDDKYTSALPTSSSGSNKVVICNIHVLYNPKRGEIKLGQIRVLLERSHAVSKLWDDAPVVLCGDFNCTPKSPLYNYISEQKLIFPSFRDHSSHNSVQSPQLVDQRQGGQSDSLSDAQKQNGPDSNLGNDSFMKSLSHLQCNNTVLNVSDSSFINGKYGNKNSALTKETHQDVVDGSKDEIESTICVPAGGLKESPSSSDNEGGFSVDQMKGGTHEFIHVDSCHKDVYSNVIETGHGEKVYATFNAECGSSSEKSESNSYAENKSGNCNKGNLSFTGDVYSSDSITNPEPASVSNLDIASSESFHRTSFLNAVEDSSGSAGYLSSLSVANDKGNPSTSFEVDISSDSTNIDFVGDGKMENLSPNELFEATKEDESLGEDCTTFLSELHNISGRFPSVSKFIRSDFVKSDESSKEYVTIPHSEQLHTSSDEVLDDDSLGVESMLADVMRTTYDPSAWTPMELETATGTADCTNMEHPLKLRSTYAEVEDYSGTRDSNGEPLVTSYNRCFLGTVDYIWRSEGLQTVRVLAPISKHAMQWTPGFPTKKWGSDHIALVSELAFTKV